MVGEERERRAGFDVGGGCRFGRGLILVLLVCILSVNHSHSFIMISLYLIWVNCELDVSLVCKIRNWWVMTFS